MSILKVDTLQPATGARVSSAGHIIQVVQYADATNYTTSSTSAVQASQTGTFTLTNSSNKVLVTVNCLARAARSSASGVRLAIYRGSIASTNLHNRQWYRTILNEYFTVFRYPKCCFCYLLSWFL